MNQYEAGSMFSDFLTGTFDRLKGYYKGFRLDFPPKERAFLKLYGQYEITQITICRSPIHQALDSVLNILSLGKWDDLKTQYNFDKMFHLFLVIRLSNQHAVRLEKNEVVRIANTFKLDNDTEFDEIHLHGKKITLDELLRNTINAVGSKQFFIYSPWNENCQRFILDILHSNGLLDEQSKQFIYQDLTELIQELPAVTKVIGQKVTDTAHALNLLVHGSSLNK
ncbi:MAG: hypothetical protein JSS98_01560 [Bacteroidetes bacterium]|nr:hypothetical protein [Bacteroidota bacterium]